MAGVIEMSTLLWKGQFDSSQLNLGMQSAQSQVAGLQGKFGGLSNFMSKTLLGGVLGLSGGLTAMGAAGIKSALDLQNSMKNFQAQTGMSTNEVNKVKEAVKNMYVATGRSYQDLTSMATKMHNELGMGAGDITKYQKGWVNFAKVTNQSDDEVVDGIAGIKNAWHLSDSQIQPILDKLILSNQKYGLSVDESEQSLRTLAPAFSAVGMNVNQAISYLDLFKKAGLDSSNATSAFRIALTKVKSPEELQTIITKMEQTSDNSARAKLGIEYFGKSGIQMAAALKPGSTSLADIQKALNGAAGASDKAAKALGNGNITAELGKLKRTTQDLLETMGEKALPTIQNLVNFISGNMPKIQSAMSGAFTVGGKAISIFGDAIKLALEHSQLLSPVIAGVAASMAALKITGTITKLMKDWNENTVIQTIAQKGLNAAMDANPIGTVITLIGLCVTAGVALYENWGTIKKVAGELKTSIETHFNNIKTDIINAWQSAKTKTSETWNNIKTEVGTKVDSIKEDIGSKFGSIKQSIEEKWNQVKENTNTTWGAIKQDINTHGGGIKGVIGTYMDYYKQIWRTGFEDMNNITGGKLGDIWNSVKTKMQQIHNTLLNWKGKLQEAWNEIWNFKMPHIKLPHFSITGSFSLDPPSIPHIDVDWYAKGGIFNSPQIVGVGDAPGGEAVVPLDKLNDIIYNSMNKVNNSIPQKTEKHYHFENIKLEFPNVIDGQDVINKINNLPSEIEQYINSNDR